MKTVLLLLLLATTQIAFGQSDQIVIEGRESTGWKFKVIPTFNYAQTYQKSVMDVTYTEDDKTAQVTRHNSFNNYFSLGSKLQLGYRINEKWSTGIQAGMSFGVEFYYIIPNFKAHLSAGAYGEYHFSSQFSFLGVVNTNKIYRYTPNVSFGGGPQIMLGKRDHIGLRFIAEYGVGGTRLGQSEYYGSDHNGQYIINHADRTNTALLLEFGMVMKIRN